MRFYYTSIPNDTVFGLSDVATPSLVVSYYDDFEAQIGILDTSALRLRDSYRLEVATEAMNLQSWYNFGMVVDNSTDTMRLFVQSDQDLDFSTRKELTSAVGLINFRNGLTANDLSSILIRTYNGFVQPSIYFDDFYIDRAGMNLANPVAVPEPSTVALILLAALGFLGRRATGRTVKKRPQLQARAPVFASSAVAG